MSYISGFFDAVDLGGGEYDRVYNAEAFAHYFSLLVKNGVFPDPSTGLMVKASSALDMSVTVQPGSGWINGYYITVDSDSPESLTINTASASLPRIDSVVIGLNHSKREIQLYVRAGAVSANPSPVSLQRNSDIYELELAQILVSGGSSGISQSNITDMRMDAERCGVVTGTIDQIDTTELFEQYNNAFQTWFNSIKETLSGDVAGNLKSQIDTLDSSKAPNKHSSSSDTYGKGNDSEYGHVKLSDSVSSEYGTANGVASTPKAVKAAYDLANTAASTLLGNKKIVCGWTNVAYKQGTMLYTTISFGITFTSKPVVVIGQPFNGAVCVVKESSVGTSSFTVAVPGVGDSSEEQERPMSWIAIGTYLQAIG